MVRLLVTNSQATEMDTESIQLLQYTQSYDRTSIASTIQEEDNDNQSSVETFDSDSDNKDNKMITVDKNLTDSEKKN